jgi:hypothetical protein
MFKQTVTLTDSMPGKEPEVDSLVVSPKREKPEVFHRKMRENPEVYPLFITEVGKPVVDSIPVSPRQGNLRWFRGF